MGKFEWLKTIKESHGSVAVNALMLAENINANGIYYIGKLGESTMDVGTNVSELIIIIFARYVCLNEQVQVTL